MKKFLIVLTIALVLGGGWYYRREPKTGAATPSPTAASRLMARAEKRDIDDSIEVSGDILPAFQLDVKPEVGGKIKVLAVVPGQVVKQGELLVQVDDTDLLKQKQSSQTEIEGANLRVDIARKNFARGKELFASKLIPQESYDTLFSDLALSENSLVKAQRAMDQIDETLKKTKVVSPTEGTVLTVPVTEGQVVIAAASVNSGTTLMTIANLSKLLVQTHINQVDVARLELEKDVKLRAESLHDLDMNARITFIAPIATVTNNVKGFDVRATVDKPNPRLRCGMTVLMTVPIAHAQAAVTVPISAIFKGEGNSKVVYVRSGETTEKRQVKTGVSTIDYVQILNGLHEGEEILLVEPATGPRKS